MKMMLNVAIILAAAAHAEQFDRAGEPYILHCLKVMHYIKNTDEELLCIAVLHDVLEDTTVTVDILAAEGMSKRVIDGVVAMTKLPEHKNDYDAYIKQVMNNPDAIKVKMADLRHNMDIRRLKGVTDKDMNRIAKYARAYKQLETAL